MLVLWEGRVVAIAHLLRGPATHLTIGLANSTALANTRGTLDGAGRVTGTLTVPVLTSSIVIGTGFHHSYVVYDAQGNFYMASNSAQLQLRK